MHIHYVTIIFLYLSCYSVAYGDILCKFNAFDTVTNQEEPVWSCHEGINRDKPGQIVWTGVACIVAETSMAEKLVLFNLSHCGMCSSS